MSHNRQDTGMRLIYQAIREIRNGCPEMLQVLPQRVMELELPDMDGGDISRLWIVQNDWRERRPWKRTNNVWKRDASPWRHKKIRKCNYGMLI